MITKEEILDYVTDTPENTNRNVLNSMLDNYGSSGGANIITCELSAGGEDGMTLTATKTAGELMAADYVYFYISDSEGPKVFANLLQEGVAVDGLHIFTLGIYDGNDNILVNLSAESADGYPSGSPDGHVGVVDDNPPDLEDGGGSPT